MLKWIGKWGLPVAAGLVLLVGVALQVAARMKPVPEGSLERPLKELIPAHVEGWEVNELDLGPTESVVQRSYDLLRLDDFVHREYRRGDRSFTVYIAYWKPGKMPVRLVNQHTPDRCWTEVGWVCTDRLWNINKTVNGVALQPAQWGVYEIHDYKNHTYFWHIVGGKAHWYGGERLNTQSSLTSVLADITKFGLNVYQEQFFIRIVSPHPMDDLWDDPGFLAVMADLAELCLAEPQPDPPVALK